MYSIRFQLCFTFPFHILVNFIRLYENELCKFNFEKKPHCIKQVVFQLLFSVIGSLRPSFFYFTVIEVPREFFYCKAPYRLSMVFSLKHWNYWATQINFLEHSLPAFSLRCPSVYRPTTFSLFFIVIFCSIFALLTFW